jgi:mono/diheme cytochrome c family protein
VTKTLIAAGFLAAAGALVAAQTTAPRPASPAAPRPVSRPAARTQPVSAPAAAAVAPGDAATQRALMDKYCVTCHNAKTKTADLLLDQLDLTHLSDRADIGETVVRKVRAGLMPPTGMPRPKPAELAGLISWMENEMDRGSKLHLPAPGLHRLNRTEYTNAIRDLLALDVDATKFLPADDSTRGFDNIAGALTMSPALMEAYLSAAGKISRLALGDINAPTQAVFDVPADTAQNHHIEGLPFGTRGGILIKHQFPVDGEYAFKVKGVTGYFQAVLGGVTGEQLEVTVDGERVKLFDWDKEISNTTGNGRATPKIPITAGEHTVGVTFLATNDIPGSELNRPFERTMNTPGSIPGFQFYPHVGQVEIEGPYNIKGAGHTATRSKIFVCTPSASAKATARLSAGSAALDPGDAACARRIVSTLAKHAFRRPVTATDVNGLMKFFDEGRREEGSFDGGVEAALQRILADPEFIYRGEPEPGTLAAGRPYKIGDLALASRLSFFLWSSIPDDTLLDLAARKQLSNPVVLEKQVRRMLADPKSEALVKNFTGQWLGVRSLAASEPVVNLFPDFDDNLREAYQREVELFFGSVVQEDHSVLDLLDAKYTYVNERLAKEYGIPNIYGPRMRRVTLPDALDMRRGLLGKGALLTVTSNAARTSPVTRGKWFLTTFLGVAPPSPPPNVPAFVERKQDTTGNTRPPTMREALQMHRISATCSACHQIFEPMGLALENFDATGSWRTLDEGQPIDASGLMPDGTKITGVVDLRNALRSRYSDQFAEVVAEKLLTYAVGRGTEFDDMPMVRRIARDAAKNQYRFSAMVMSIVKSDIFQMNQKAATTQTARAAN